MGSAFRALRYRNYRLYFVGHLISMMGSWMQSMVVAWLVFRVTRSASWLGAIGFCNQAAAFAVSPWVGLAIERWDRRKTLIWVEWLGVIQALVLALLAYFNLVTMGPMAALAIGGGVIASFEITLRHTFSVDLVDRKDFGSAIALNSMIINASRIVVPALVGTLLAVLPWTQGETLCFLLNAVSYLAVIGSLTLMRTIPVSSVVFQAPSVGELLGDTLKHVLKTPRIRRLIGLASYMSFTVIPPMIAYPVLAKVTLSGDSRTLAWLSGVSGVGAVLGALVLTTWQPVRSLTRWVLIVMALNGFSLVALAFSSTLIAAAASSFFIGFFLMGIYPTINLALQKTSHPSWRARIISVYTMSFLGLARLQACTGLSH